MSGRQQFFENSRNLTGDVVPVDLAVVKDRAPWAGFFVRVESGVFAFSDAQTAQEFAGEVATVTTR